MKIFKLFPASLLISFMGIMGLPAIAYSAFHYVYLSDPDLVYTNHGKLKIEWQKFSENDSFTEYLSKKREVNDEEMKVEVLVMRSYAQPQSSLHERVRYVYSSVVMRQTVSCLSRVVSVQDLLMFSKALSGGGIVKDMYDLDWDMGEAREDSIDEMKVKELCNLSV